MNEEPWILNEDDLVKCSRCDEKAYTIWKDYCEDIVVDTPLCFIHQDKCFYCDKEAIAVEPNLKSRKLLFSCHEHAIQRMKDATGFKVDSEDLKMMKKIANLEKRIAKKINEKQKEKVDA